MDAKTKTKPADNTLYRKYRPTEWKHVIGQKAVVSALAESIEGRRAHCYLLSGPSGTGKTTLARIAAAELGCGTNDIIEIDGATHTGIDAMRGIQEMMYYRPMFGETKVAIVDEAHRLSGQAWDSLLKATEEPPEHAFWFLCTTNPTKVPSTIRTRATSFQLKAVDDKSIKTLLEEVADEESFKVSDVVIDLVVREARGSPRQALNYLDVVANITDRKQAAELLHTVLDEDPIRELCQVLIKKESWVKAMGLINSMGSENAESIRYQVLGYFAVVAKNAKDNRAAGAAVTIMDQFATPYNHSENLAPLIISVARVLLTD